MGDLGLEQTVPAKSDNDLSDYFGHLIERFNNGLALDNLRLVERYVNRELHILLKFRMVDGAEFVACLQWDAGDGDQMPFEVRSALTWMTVHEDFLELRSFTWRSAAAHVRRAGGKQQAVLVNLVKFVDTPERIVPTFVWFDRMDRVFSLLPHALYFSVEEGRHVFCGIASNWETALRGNGATSLADEMAGKMVEGTSQVLQNVPDNQRDLQRHLGNALDVIGALLRIQIILEPNGIWLATPAGECFKQDIPQVVDVLYGPFGLGE